MYVCVDFDGTIVDHRYPDIGAPVPGAIKWLKRLQEKGARLILYTMRADDPGRELLSDAVRYLQAEGVRLYGVNRNPDQDALMMPPLAVRSSFRKTLPGHVSTGRRSVHRWSIWCSAEVEVSCDE